jgi:hypothetical protein
MQILHPTIYIPNRLLRRIVERELPGGGNPTSAQLSLVGETSNAAANDSGLVACHGSRLVLTPERGLTP